MALDTRSIYVTSLQSTHGLEMMALQIMERQVERLQHYPEMDAISAKRMGNAIAWKKH